MSKKEELGQLKNKMEKADLPLKKGATNLVFGEGNPDARIFFLGEGPGYWENMKGRPFVGNAGGLLNQLLQSIKLVREDVFITNVVCYRPPSNRDPLPEEISAFQPYIDAMLEVIRPKVVVTLGRFSMGKFLPGTKISIVHGKVFDVNWRGRQIKVVPMYHPAAALRNGNVMIQIKEDFLKLPELLKEELLKEVNSKIEAEQMELV
ncbi:MAG: Phage SPO1 DNA polymerase-related protein [Candidatus Woesebacteria bacterium GW2011_GWF1_46_13]|uniref:Type-4 uracil-DNA glycosylase n=1 Tax=Candidatus Woesebacteria bacterium GW2011_GWF1_46_13 TaxID=1618602 RepID=A0A0G1R4F8_9BACT|nr:MAG: Phage SPO1 DNA polymerase-related protein [Candidatus Woesebacteria bacterium GW2011_GWF1_46_13]